jgi:hypothetical protein
MKPIIKEQISDKSHLRTDESAIYLESGKSFASHETVNHSAKEYVRGDAYTKPAFAGYHGFAASIARFTGFGNGKLPLLRAKGGRGLRLRCCNAEALPICLSQGILLPLISRLH